MRTRQLGTSSLHLTTIGFGAWAIGGNEWGPQNDAESVKAIHAAFDLGINWIDTAAIYGLGHSEQIVARALKDRPGKIIVATKCGLRWRENRSIYVSLAAESIRHEVESSLRRLELETIDLYQIHWPKPDKEIEEGWSTIADLIKEGKIRYAGVSNFSVSQMKRAQQIHPITSLQPPYSIIERRVEAEILPFCCDQGIGVVAYSPLQSGLLTGAFNKTRVEQLSKDDWRRKSHCFREPIFSKALELVEALNALSKQSNHSVAQLALAWVLREPVISSAIVGARRPTQIQETAIAGDWELEESLLEEIDQILDRVAVPIPSTFR